VPDLPSIVELLERLAVSEKAVAARDARIEALEHDRCPWILTVVDMAAGQQSAARLDVVHQHQGPVGFIEECEVDGQMLRRRRRRNGPKRRCPERTHATMSA
jgi:hypothetical protein